VANYVTPGEIHPLPGMSPGVIANGPFLFVSGQVAFDGDGAIVGHGDFSRQVEQAMANLQAVLRDAGSTLSDVVKIGVFLSDRKYLPQWREMRGDYFSHPYPASTLVMAELISPELLIEIEAVAAISVTGKPLNHIGPS
jgi:enamine deaminase RidA (YjgF/YER057c/UK114 family)